MSLSERLSEDLRTAMKSGDKVRLETIRMLRAALTEKIVERRGANAEMREEDELSVILSAAKKRREAIEEYRRVGREDKAREEEAELSIIQEYLPKQLSPDEIAEHIKAVAAQIGAANPKDFGRLMAAVMKDLKGKADGKIVQESVKQFLGV
ncbi:MAG: GatB/YqeY domain-containing protein [Bacteroidota bacterium]